MKDFIEITIEGGSKVTIAKRHIAFIEPLANGRAKITMDIKTSITDSKTFITNETYSELVGKFDV
jgi:hypothetical protein